MDYYETQVEAIGTDSDELEPKKGKGIGKRGKIQGS